jgi:hypothetical protein
MQRVARIIVGDLDIPVEQFTNTLRFLFCKISNILYAPSKTFCK